MMGLELREEATGTLFVERAALGDDDVPAAKIVVPDALVRIGLRLDPGLFQMARDRVAGEGEPHQLQQSPLLQPAAQPATPELRRTQREAAMGLNSVAVMLGKLGICSDGFRTRFSPGMS